jgi:hypothetical protein
VRVVVARYAFTADPAFVDSLQAAAAQDIAAAFLRSMGLGRSVSSSDMVHGPGRDAYLAGSAWLGQRTAERIRTAVARFEEAIELAPHARRCPCRPHW